VGFNLPARRAEGIPKRDMQVFVRSVSSRFASHDHLTLRKRQAYPNVTDPSLPLMAMRGLEGDRAADGASSGVAPEDSLEPG
jgi:hypothetical protein